MKKSGIHGLLLILLLIAGYTTKAQGTLGLYTTSISNSTPAMGEQFSLFTKLINTSATDTFKGVIDFELANENGIINDFNIFGEPAVSGTFLTLAPLEERALLFTVTPQPAYFVPGPDIIIVWPIAPAPIVDSARAPIDILEPSGIEETTPDLCTISTYSNWLTVLISNQKDALQHVRIFNIAGELLADEKPGTSKANIPIGRLNKGVYIVDVVTQQGNHKTMKFVR